MSIYATSSEFDYAKSVLIDTCILPQRMSLELRVSHIRELVAKATDIYSSGLLHAENPLPLARQSFDKIIGELDAWNTLEGASANDEKWKQLFQDAA